MSTIYLGKANKLKWELLVNNKTIPTNAIVGAEIEVPGEAFDDNQPVIYSVQSGDIEMIEDGTVLEIDLSDKNINPGRYYCKLSVYDGTDVDPIAWSEEVINFKDWR